MPRYAVMFEIEHGQWEYMRENTAVFDNNTPVKVFELLAEAQAAADTWNTGRVVEWSEPKEWFVDRAKHIREMTDDERQRAKERKEKNSDQ